MCGQTYYLHAKSLTFFEQCVVWWSSRSEIGLLQGIHSMKTQSQSLDSAFIMNEFEICEMCIPGGYSSKKEKMNQTIVTAAKLFGAALSNITYLAEYFPLLTRL